MIDFSQDMVEVNTISESNSVAFKINLGASAFGNPKNSYLKINDVDFGAVPTAPGLNVRALNSLITPPETKSFNLTNVNSSMNTSFIDWINLQTAPIILIVSSGILRSSDSVDSWFSGVGSVNWPGSFLCNNYQYSYVGIYSTTKKKMIMESMAGYNSSPNDAFCVLETVCDTLEDIGSTGFIKSAIYDPNETLTTTDYEFKRYPIDGGLVAPIANYGIKPNSIMMLCGELLQSSEMVAAGQTTRLNIRWYNGSTLISSSSISPPNNIVDQWYNFQDNFSVVPANANGFTIVVARYPRNDSVVALAGVKNITFSEVSRADKTTGPASIGVNGVQMNTFVDSSIGNLLLELPDSVTKTENKVTFVGLKERELPY